MLLSQDDNFSRKRFTDVDAYKSWLNIVRKVIYNSEYPYDVEVIDKTGWSMNRTDQLKLVAQGGYGNITASRSIDLRNCFKKLAKADTIKLPKSITHYADQSSLRWASRVNDWQSCLPAGQKIAKIVQSTAVEETDLLNILYYTIPESCIINGISYTKAQMLALSFLYSASSLSEYLHDKSECLNFIHNVAKYEVSLSKLAIEYAESGYTTIEEISEQLILRLSSGLHHEKIGAEIRTKNYEQVDEYTIPPPRIGTMIVPEVSKNALPKWAHPIFSSIDRFNPIQSCTMASAFLSDGNLVIAAPTGAGKTNVALLAIARALAKNAYLTKYENSQGFSTIDAKRKFNEFLRNSNYLDKISPKRKIVYCAPMKALVREIALKFKQALKSFNISVVEATSDSNVTRESLSGAHLVITVPEKWDIITRRIVTDTDTEIKLICDLLIVDEIHMVYEDRGPVVESIIARTHINNKKLDHPTRIVTISATLPNHEEIADFIRAEHSHNFGPVFRPIPLKQVLLGIKGTSKVTCREHSKLLYLTLRSRLYASLYNDVETKDEWSSLNINTAKKRIPIDIQNAWMNFCHNTTNGWYQQEENKNNKNTNEKKTETPKLVDEKELVACDYSPEELQGLSRIEQKTTTRHKKKRKGTNKPYRTDTTEIQKTEPVPEAAPKSTLFANPSYTTVAPWVMDLTEVSGPSDGQAMIFVHSRIGTLEVAKQILFHAGQLLEPSIFLNSSTQNFVIPGFIPKDIRDILKYGVGIHHAGLSREIRIFMENAFSAGKISVLVTTSTLAWGVNLPARTVIVFGTSIFNTELHEVEEMSILDLLQIFGRSGRPGLDPVGEAIVLTTEARSLPLAHTLGLDVNVWSKLYNVCDKAILGEIALQNVTDINSALQWMSHTYYYASLCRRPKLYNKPGNPGIKTERGGITFPTDSCSLWSNIVEEYKQLQALHESGELQTCPKEIISLAPGISSTVPKNVPMITVTYGEGTGITVLPLNTIPIIGSHYISVIPEESQGIDSRASCIVHNAIEDLKKIQLITAVSNYFRCTVAGLIVGKYYLSPSDGAALLQLPPSNSLEECISNVALCEEFAHVKGRQDNNDALINVAQSIAKAGFVVPRAWLIDPKPRHHMFGVLLFAHMCKIKLPVYSLVCDQAYIIDTAPRIMQAYQKLRETSSFCDAIAIELQDLSLCTELGISMVDHPLAYFHFCSAGKKPALNMPTLLQLRKHLRESTKDMQLGDFGVLTETKKDFEKLKVDASSVSVEKLMGYDSSKIRSLFGDNANTIKDILQVVPKIDIHLKAIKIGSDCFKVVVHLHPLFIWHNEWHGTRLPFQLYLASGKKISHSELIYFNPEIVHNYRKNRSAALKEGLNVKPAISLTIPLISTDYIYCVLQSQKIPLLRFTHTLYTDIIYSASDKSITTPLLNLTPLPATSITHQSGKNPLDQNILKAFFPFTFFNPIQTQIFHPMYHTLESVLVGAPTGSGKTNIAELAVLRAFQDNGTVAYIAPMKALTRERYNDWSTKFKILKKQVIICTGDSNPTPKDLCNSDIIIWTPEKLESVLRRDKMIDYMKKLHTVIFDEVHLVGQGRGPSLEGVVCILKDFEKTPRFIGLSSFIGNPECVAKWLNVKNKYIYNFNTNVRPVPAITLLDKYGSDTYCSRMASMNQSIATSIQSFSKKKGVLVFVSSRRQTRITAVALSTFTSCISTDSNTALLKNQSISLPKCGQNDLSVVRESFVRDSVISKTEDESVPNYIQEKDTENIFTLQLSDLPSRIIKQKRNDLISWSSDDEVEKNPIIQVDNKIKSSYLGELALANETKDYFNQQVNTIKDQTLKSLLYIGIGMHHAGLCTHDRTIVEQLFKERYITVLVTTSTLAWGVNLPAYMVVLKGTEYFDPGTRKYEQMDITDIVQMTGRAGRPQYDSSCILHICGTQSQIEYYKIFRNRPIPLESKIETSLPELINALCASLHICNWKNIMQYMEKTLLFQRIATSIQTYTGKISSSDGEFEQPNFTDVSNAATSYMKNIISSTLKKLHLMDFISIDEDGARCSPLGKIVAQLYITTSAGYQLYNSSIPKNNLIFDTLWWVVNIEEFSQVPTRHNEDQYSTNLLNSMPLVQHYIQNSNVDIYKPQGKAFLLICELLCNSYMTPDYRLDQSLVKDRFPSIAIAALEISNLRNDPQVFISLLVLLQALHSNRKLDDIMRLSTDDQSEHSYEYLIPLLKSFTSSNTTFKSSVDEESNLIKMDIEINNKKVTDPNMDISIKNTQIVMNTTVEISYDTEHPLYVVVYSEFSLLGAKAIVPKLNHSIKNQTNIKTAKYCLNFDIHNNGTLYISVIDTSDLKLDITTELKLKFEK